MEDAVLVVVAQNKRNDAASSLYPFAGFDVAVASLGNGCGIIRWPRLHVAGLLAGAGSKRRSGEEFFMP